MLQRRRGRRSTRAAVLVAALFCGACAPGPIKLPSGPGTPAADGAEILREATEPCGRVTSITAELAVSGSVAGRRLRGRLLAGMAAPASARLEAVAPFGPPVFVFVSRDRDATLLLPRDRRVLEHGRPQAVLEAVTGVPLDAAELRLTLTACPIGPRAGEAKQFGDEWRIVPDEAGAVYLHREPRGGPWRVVVAVHGSTSASMWRAEYAEYQRAGPIGGLPSIVRLISADAKRFDLRLALSQIEVNTALDADAFRVQVPRDALPITLEELQQSGPLGR